MAKVAITCNSSESASVFPAFILGGAAASLGDAVTLFFTPAAAQALVRGRLEEMKGAKGLPDIIELYDSFRSLGGKIYACDLTSGVEGLSEDDFRCGVELIGAVTFMSQIRDVTITFSF